jgi:uncharacterized protein (TIGR02449 family)
MDFPVLFTELEEQAELLIETCKTLKQENHQLQQELKYLTAECKELRQRHTTAADKLMAVIQQLKLISECEPEV